MRYFAILSLFMLVAGLFAFDGQDGAWAQNQALAQHAGFSDPGSRAVAGGSGGLIAVQSSVDGGTVPVGATAQVVVRFRNEGSQPVQTGLIRLYPSSNVTGEVSLNQCQEGALPAGAECAIALSIKALQAGSWRVEMLMSHSGRTRLVTATVSGTAESAGEGGDRLSSDIEAIPDELDFETLASSQTLVEPIVLRNITSNPINIEELYIDTSESSGFALKSECDVLRAGQACIAVVSWSPQLNGRSSGVLVVKHDGPTALTSVPLAGEYEPDNVESAQVFPQAVPGRGLLVSSQTEVNFGSNIATASTITVSLVNAGDVPLNIKNISLSGSDNGLDFKDGGCSAGMTLDPIEACALTVNWSPTRVGAVYDDIQIHHDGARGVLVLPVRGESSGTVSQDQKAIVLSDRIVSGGPVAPPPARQPPPPDATGSLSASDLDPSSQAQAQRAATQNRQRLAQPASFSMPTVSNPASVLDGYKITSFSPSRAIINGPGGSRIVFDGEEIVLGGVQWFVMIQPNGIEFLHQGQRVLLLFDRSLSSINRVTASSGTNSGSGSGTGDSQGGGE